MLTSAPRCSLSHPGGVRCPRARVTAEVSGRFSAVSPVELFRRSGEQGHFLWRFKRKRYRMRKGDIMKGNMTSIIPPYKQQLFVVYVESLQ